MIASTEAATHTNSSDDLGLADFDFDMNDNNDAPTNNTVQQQQQYHPTNFYSICCGESSDTARRIIQQGDLCQLQWTRIQHYYMDTASKEIAKRILGFTQVPFYVFVNPRGEIVQMGNKTIDWSVLESVRPMSVVVEPSIIAPSVTTTTMEDAMMMESVATADDKDDDDNKAMEAVPTVSPTSIAEPVFELDDDMDF